MFFQPVIRIQISLGFLQSNVHKWQNNILPLVLDTIINVHADSQISFKILGHGFISFLQNNIWLDEGAGHFLQNISKKLELCLHNSYCKFNKKIAAVTTAMPIKLICWSVIVSWNNINSKIKKIFMRVPSMTLWKLANFKN